MGNYQHIPKLIYSPSWSSWSMQERDRYDCWGEYAQGIGDKVIFQFYYSGSSCSPAEDKQRHTYR